LESIIINVSSSIMTTIEMNDRSHVRSWEPNEVAHSCPKCRTGLGLTQWKHHCRSCGKIFCASCCSSYVRLPSTAVCPSIPHYVDRRDPQRCCGDCAQRIKESTVVQNRQVVQQSRYFRETLGIRTTDTLELIRSLPTKLYLVQVPANMAMHRNQVVSMNLEGSRHHAVVPYGLGPGDSFYVRANDGFVGPRTHYYYRPQPDRVVYTEVLIVRVPDELASAPEEVEHVPEDAFLECPQCTYHNYLHMGRCSMCHARLIV
jgi:hypothetical protein